MTISWHCILYLFGRELFECQQIKYSISNYKDLIWSLSSELLSSISFRSSRAGTIWPPSLHLTDRGYSWNGQHPHRLQLEGLSQPLCRQLYRLTSGERLGESFQRKKMGRGRGGGVAVRSKYSLGFTDDLWFLKNKIDKNQPILPLYHHRLLSISKL